MLKRFSLIFSTVSHLKLTQVKYQLQYRLIKTGSLSTYRTKVDLNGIEYLNFIQEPPVYPSYHGKNSFEFLNQRYDFGEKIDWRFREYGALWNYNLQYLNGLFQEDVELKEKFRLVNSLYSSGIPLEPYPVSLRSINVMRLISKENLRDAELLENLHAELNFLSQRPEYHLLGNHLLENAFALMMGGAFFSNNQWLLQGEKILAEQLKEQILEDGAHFELSPMYHQIILFRLLELIDWYGQYLGFKESFLEFLMERAERMCSWLENISFGNGKIPHFNDSTEGVSYSTPWLLAYADALDIERKNISLGASGYRSFKTGVYECKVDVAQIGSSYQPGHGHADTFTFAINIKNREVFVEAGTSTYEANKVRQNQRSTESHNTVVVNNQNQSQVYGGFRVGKRARTKIMQDSSTILTANHDGYKKSLNLTHQRTFKFSPNSIKILDILDREIPSCAYFHFHPSIEIRLQDNVCLFGNMGSISFENGNVSIISYNFALGYNKTTVASALKVCFLTKLETEIKILNL